MLMCHSSRIVIHEAEGEQHDEHGILINLSFSFCERPRLGLLGAVGQASSCFPSFSEC